jgi:hypothetical protein
MGGGKKDTGFDKETEGREEDRERELTEEARREVVWGENQGKWSKIEMK